MAELQKISSRIKSIKTTRKITKAMELVATSKLRKAKEIFFANKEYFQTVLNLFEDIAEKIDKNLLKNQITFDKKNTSESILYVVINSDLGLCGAYNSNIAKEIKKIINQEDKIFVIGTKGFSFLSKYKKQIINQNDIKEIEINFDKTKKISEKIFALFKTGNYKKISIVYTKYINSLSYEPNFIQALPIEKKSGKIKEKNNHTSIDFEFEPDPMTVFKIALPLYFDSLIYGSIVESHVSEISSRRIAMENATKNADELNDKLLIEYNRIRQGKITQEITEIIAGSEIEI